MIRHRYEGVHVRYIGHAPCTDGYGDLLGPDDVTAPAELPNGAPGMLCHTCSQYLEGVALKLVSSALYQLGV